MNYGFDENKNKQEIFIKKDFVVLKQEHIFADNDTFVLFNFFFPDNTWTIDNTKIISGKSIYYTPISTGFEVGQIRQIPSSVIVLGQLNENLNVWENYSILVNPYGYSSQFEEADITVEYARNTKPTAGHKLVVELVLMKIDSEVE